MSSPISDGRVILTLRRWRALSLSHRERGGDPSRSGRGGVRVTALALLLSACGQPAESPQNLAQTHPPAEQAATPQVEHIACARGAAALRPDCTLDRESTRDGERWTIRHPDGSFRRLIVRGQDVETADGAELLRGHAGDATVADEHYRLPPR